MKILVVVAHPDDEVLGCGGTLAKHAKDGDEVFVLALGDGETSRPGAKVEARREQLIQACQTLGVQKVSALDFADNRFDQYPLLEVIQKIEQEVKDFHPEVIYTHSNADLNVDHRVAHEAVLTAFRGVPRSSVRKILTFEIPSSTEWSSVQSRSQFVPNCFVNISETLSTKLEALKCYDSEMREAPHPRSFKVVEALATVRGSQAGLNAAEAFFVERVIEP
ncbi:MAG TPA: GlcNAc-PI de-N-acetylase [Bdellovibrionales bacterium]|nr:GlcNAc-PI de-N-acetylase [Pseudobdellovibrionaceae bacterium]HAG92241.1 GlcNAc-PI de-N-acetylase [Bdellovibrionales bacterium]|tara:strand:+ start:6129 stop:6791 length:663 start_codon:yes stop_codon:yes gene_type:complete